MASSSSESGGVLFVYEEDGLDWVKYLMRLLGGPAYSIPCASVLWHKLDQQLTSCNPVHVLFLTPEMAAHVSEIKFDLLNYASETSLLVDCNIDYPPPGMVEWATKHTLEYCEENQQALLATIIESYETAVNFVPDVDIVPTDDLSTPETNREKRSVRVTKVMNTRMLHVCLPGRIVNLDWYNLSD